MTSDSDSEQQTCQIDLSPFHIRSKHTSDSKSLLYQGQIPSHKDSESEDQSDPRIISPLANLPRGNSNPSLNRPSKEVTCLGGTASATASAVVKPIEEKSDKKKYIVDCLEKPWNFHMMLQLKSIGERSNGYKWMHNEELEYYTIAARYTMVMEIVLVTLHGASIASSFVALFADKNNQIAIIIITCFQTVLYILSMIIKTYREGMAFDEKIYNHRWTLLKFSQLSSQIQNQFCLPVSRRSDDQSFLEYRSNDFNDILFGAPVIRPITKQRYLDTIKDSEIAKALALSNINQIEIIMEQEKNSDQVTPLPKQPEETNTNYRYQLDRFFRGSDPSPFNPLSGVPTPTTHYFP